MPAKIILKEPDVVHDWGRVSQVSTRGNYDIPRVLSSAQQ